MRPVTKYNISALDSCSSFDIKDSLRVFSPFGDRRKTVFTGSTTIDNSLTEISVFTDSLDIAHLQLGEVFVPLIKNDIVYSLSIVPISPNYLIQLLTQIHKDTNARAIFHHEIIDSKLKLTKVGEDIRKPNSWAIVYIAACLQPDCSSYILSCPIYEHNSNLTVPHGYLFIHDKVERKRMESIVDMLMCLQIT